jgi:hypothetical protein
MRHDKPIAVLSASLIDGFEYLRANYELKMVNRVDGRAVEITGQEFRVITEGKDVHGYEFHSVVETDRFVMNPDREYLREAVNLRIR